MFYNKIFEVCSSKNISVTNLCSSVGISSGVISRWKGGSIPSGETLVKIANFLDISIDYLLDRTETSKVINLPDKVIEIITDKYNSNPKKFIADDFITPPSRAAQKPEYVFAPQDYDEKYIVIFDEALAYAKDNDIDIEEVTGVKSKAEYMAMVTLRDDLISRMAKWECWAFNSQQDYFKFREVYKLYCKSYEQYVKQTFGE